MQKPVVLVTTMDDVKSIIDELGAALEENQILIKIVSKEDFLHFLPKVKADEKVTVPVDLTDEQFLALAKIAHEKDITFNELAEDIIRQEMAKAK